MKTHKLKIWRKNLQLNQAKLAEKLGVTSSFISQLETGKKRPSLEMALKIEDLTD